MIIESMFDLEKLNAVDLRTVDKSTLIDIREVSINDKLPKEERIADFLRQVKNPYLCRCGNIVVQSVFADTDVTLTERLKQYFRMV